MSLANKIKAGMAYIELSLDGAKLEGGLKKAQRSLRQFGSSMQVAGGDLLKLSGMMAVPMGLAVKTFASFDDTMRVVQAISQATTQEFTKLTATARKLGATTAFTAQQVAEGMVSLARMGFTASEVDDAMESMLLLTRATGNEVFRLGEITLIAGSAMRTFGLASSEAGDVADLLTYAANNSAQSVQDLGEALKTAGPSARTVKEDLRDVAAATMALAQMGIKGSLAGTALRKSYDSLSRQTSVFRTEMKDLGIDVTQDNGELRKMVDIMGDLAVKFRTMTGPQALEKAREIFDLRGSLAALALTTDPASFKRFRSEINNVAGLAKRTHDKMEEGIGGTFKFILSRIQELSIVVGEAINEEFKEFFKIIVNILDGLGDWARSNQKLIAQFGAIAVGVAGAGAAMIAFGLAVKVVASSIGILIGALKILGVVTTLLQMKFLLPLAALGVVVLGVTAGIAALNDEFGSFAGKLGNLAGNFITAFGRIKKVVSDAFQTIAQSIKDGDLAGASKVGLAALYLSWVEGIAPIKKIWLELSSFIGDAFAVAAGNVLKIMGTITHGIRYAMKSTGQDFKAGVDLVSDGVTNMLDPNKGRAVERNKKSLSKLDKDREELYQMSVKHASNMKNLDAATSQSIQESLDKLGKGGTDIEEQLTWARNNLNREKGTAANYPEFKKTVELLQKTFDEAKRGYQTSGKGTDVAAQNQDAYFTMLLKNNKVAASIQIKNAIDAEEEKLKLQKDLWQQAVNEAKADRVISSEEAQGINALAFGKGRAESRMAELKNMLASLSLGTTRAANAVDEKALGKEQVTGSWSAKILSAMIGKNYEQRTADATEALLKETKDTNRIIKNSWGVPMATWN